MAVHLITGHAGTPHVTSQDQRRQNAVLLGSGSFIINGCACTIKSANTLHVDEGLLYVNGAFVTVTSGGQDVAIQSGVVGETRTDYVVLRYSVSGSGIESAEIIAKNGAQASGGNILDGATTAEFNLYSVTLTGVSVGVPVQIMADFSAIAAFGLGSLALKNSLAAGDIPNLAASKITSGTFDAARIPSLGASKIASGTLSADRIPTLATSKISGLGTGATISPSDYPVAVKTNGGKNTFNYIKFNSGACFIWGWFQESQQHTLTTDYPLVMTDRALPFTVYHAFMSFQSYDWGWFGYSGPAGTTDMSYTSATVRVWPVANNRIAPTYGIFVSGRWK